MCACVCVLTLQSSSPSPNTPGGASSSELRSRCTFSASGSRRRTTTPTNTRPRGFAFTHARVTHQSVRVHAPRGGGSRGSIPNTHGRAPHLPHRRRGHGAVLRKLHRGEGVDTSIDMFQIQAPLYMCDQHDSPSSTAGSWRALGCSGV